MTETVAFKKVHPAAIIPSYGSDGAIGLDLYAIEDGTIPAMAPLVIQTGIAFKPPPGTYGRVAPRSGLSARSGVIILGGVVDPDFRTGIGVIAMALPEPVPFKAGDRIAQLVLERAVRARPEEVDELPDTARGERGFGSTGL